MKKYLLLFFLIFVFSNLYSQNKTPIIINSNLLQNNYSQSNADIFPDSNKGYLIRWEDSRYGTPTYLAQKYDMNSQKIDDKFIVKNYFHISYFAENSFWGIFRNTYTYHWMPWDDRTVTQYFGQFFNETNNNSDSIYLGGGEYPWCGTGWPGEGASLSKYNDELIAAIDFGGGITCRKIFSNGEDSLIYPTETDDLDYGYSVSTAYNKKGESIIAFYGFEEYDSAGIYIKSFTSNNNLIIKKRIKKLHEEEFDWGIRLNLKTISVSDTLFQLLFIDSLKLKTITVDVFGNIHRENEFPILYQNDYSDYYLYEDDLMSISNYNNGSRAVFIHIFEYPDKYSNSLYYFDSDGRLIDEPLFNRTISYDFGNEIFKDENDNFVFPAIINKKAYLLKYDNFTQLDSVLISAEESNSNESKPGISKYPDGQFFVSYRNEIRTAGRFIFKEGNPISEEKEIDSQSLQFFSDGSVLKIWTKKEADYKMTKGFSILDSEFNVLKTDTLVFNYDNYYGFCSSNISQNDNIIIVYQNISGVFAAKYDKNGEEIKTVRLSVNNRGSVGSRIFFDDLTTYIHCHNHIYKISEDFIIENISDKIVYSIFAYLGVDKFAGSLYDYQDKQSAYSVFNANGDTLIANIPMISRDQSDPMVMGHAEDDEFIVFYLKDQKLFANTYNSLGENTVNQFLIHEAENEVIKDIRFTVNGNKVLFAWAGKPIGEHDFDIYCVSYDLDLLTDINEDSENNLPTEFSLSQNYPNPFNPSTAISYTLPSSVKGETANVRLIVYDVLGREVATLINEQQKPGNYEVKFDARHLTSGIYFYQLRTTPNGGQARQKEGGQAGGFVETKKMILLK